MYRSSTGKVNVSVVFNNDTFWLSQKRMAELFGVAVSTINYHLNQINESGELQLSAAIRKIRIPSDNCDEPGIHEEAEAKALGEYEKFWRIQDQTFLSDFDKFLESIK